MQCEAPIKLQLRCNLAELLRASHCKVTAPHLEKDLLPISAAGLATQLDVAKQTILPLVMTQKGGRAAPITVNFATGLRRLRR